MLLRLLYTRVPTHSNKATMSATSPPPAGNSFGESGVTTTVIAQPNAALTAQQRTADAIQSIMFNGAFDSAAWRQVESFASEKAREMRTERLKRGSRDVSAAHGAADQSRSHQQPRKILKVKSR